jgi:3-deoxy-7-phosphoheptulonate synthase
MAKKINCNLEEIPLPTPEELRCRHPLLSPQREFIEEARTQISHILNDEDSRLLLIVGPCSIHDLEAAKEYALKLRALASEISDFFYVVMRVYYEKPRTTTGWKGLLYDPHLDGSHDICEGLNLTRTLLLDLASLEIPVAAEFLDPFSAHYFADLISWGCIGARTSESQIHRQMASGLSMPIAFKNSTSGNIEVAINGVLSASLPQTFIGINDQGYVARQQTTGNPYGHIVLRGGEHKPNYDPESIFLALQRLRQEGLPERVIIDCSHDNSRRQHEQQIAVFESVIHQSLEGELGIRGLILESHLHAGNQPLTQDLNQLHYAVSLTDACIDWETTERLIRWGYRLLSKEKIDSQKPFSSEQHYATSSF